MESSESDPPVLVSVADPRHVEQLVRTGGDIALARGVPVRIVSVVAKPASSPFAVFDDETIIQEFSGNRQELLDRATSVAPADVPVEGEVIVGRSVSDAVLRAIGTHGASALVVGWIERQRRNAVLGTTVDRLIAGAACDLYVERIGSEANAVNSVLLPVAGGPHLPTAAAGAKAIASRNEAEVVVLSVATAESDLAEANTFVEEGVKAVLAAPGGSVSISQKTDIGSDTVGVIAKAAAEHDVAVLGATRQGRLRRRLVGSIPRALVSQSNTTVILARNGNTVPGPMLQRVLGIVRD